MKKLIFALARQTVIGLAIFSYVTTAQNLSAKGPPKAGGGLSVDTASHRPHSKEFSFDIGADPLGALFASGWRPLYSFRIGYGKSFKEDQVTGHIFFQYYRYYISNSNLGMAERFFDEKVKRNDFSMYLTATFLQHTVVGVAFSYIKSDEVGYVDYFRYPSNFPWEYGNLSRFDVSYLFGLKTDLPLGNDYHLTIGIYSMVGVYGTDHYATSRIGVSKRF